MKSHELMLISVYPEMLEDIQAVCQTMHIEPTILQWEIAQQGLLDKLNDMADASKSYKNFSGISDHMDGEVKFVFVTNK